MKYSGWLAAPVLAWILFGSATGFAAVLPSTQSVVVVGLGNPDSPASPVVQSPIAPLIIPGIDAFNLGYDGASVILDGSPLTYFERGPVDYVFTAAMPLIDSGTSFTEYIFSGNVLNQSGVDWTGFTMEVGFGVGAGFIASASVGADLTFDTPTLSFALMFDGFNLLSRSQSMIEWGGHDAPQSDVFNLNWSIPISVPDITSAIPPWALVNNDTGYEFTVRHTAIPEPATGLIACLGLLALIRRRRKI